MQRETINIRRKNPIRLYETADLVPRLTAHQQKIATRIRVQSRHTGDRLHEARKPLYHQFIDAQLLIFLPTINSFGRHIDPIATIDAIFA